MARLADIVVDCHHPASLARFWAAVLDDYAVADYDDDEVARLAGLGITDLEDDPTVLVHAPSGPRLFFQRVPEPKVVKNRLHLDVRCADRAHEIHRLIALGASVLVDRPDQRWAVMSDPEGNEFCVIE